ncbi:MAG: AI-2E family transporter [Cyclobacteriaceae bacterium]|nr:AI-2E family transporter [Cyclobacteriaceae bacterium]
METKRKPFYEKLSFNLISIALILTALYLGQGVILPILFSVLLSTLLLPVVNFLVAKRIPKAISILLPLLVSIVVVAGILFLLSRQIIHFFDDSETLKTRFTEFATQAQEWLGNQLGLSEAKQADYLEDGMSKLKTLAPKAMSATFLSLTGLLTFTLLIPIYTFLILFYKETIKKFLVDSFSNASERRVEGILFESTMVARAYVLGLFIETVLVFALNVVGFLILGIRYAVFLALLAALLNNIPYIGIMVANVICILITLVSSENATDAIWVGAILGVVQFLDNNFGMPLIVGNKVKINALVTIVGILIGGVICGVPGMFLAIPGLAVMKIIFEKIDDTKPWAVLLSDQTSEKKVKKLKL